jgi:predicted RNA-binding protein with PIN domain
MHYYIDGYNVLFRAWGTGGHLEKQRKALIESLCTKIDYLHLNATIVFDAHLYLGEGSFSRHLGVRVVYTRTGQDADEYILEALERSSTPRRETVVTSDNRLAWRARCLGAETESVDAFIPWLSKRYNNRKKKEKTSKPIHPKVVLPVQLTAKPSPVEPPDKSITADMEAGSFDYYLQAFENNLHHYSSDMGKLSDRQKKQQERLIHRSSKKKPSQSSSESDMLRWLRIFEERDKQ